MRGTGFINVLLTISKLAVSVSAQNDLRPVESIETQPKANKLKASDSEKQCPNLAKLTNQPIN